MKLSFTDGVIALLWLVVLPIFLLVKLPRLEAVLTIVWLVGIPLYILLSDFAKEQKQ